MAYLPDSPFDFHSFAQPRIARITHLHLNLEVNFENKTLAGSAAYRIETIAEASEIILDIRDLTIEKIILNEDTETTYSIGKAQPYLGQPLIINLFPDTQWITIYYRTAPKAAALQWLNPGQTSGKEHPFLFTQSQAILARTWLPCQDSPGIRFTYEAQVQVPSNFLALMSADNPKGNNETGIYTFIQKRPIPAYLMALAVGDLIYNPLDDRTGVYAEPGQIAAATYEFAELPAMVIAAEALYGKYLWGRYDLLLLPPSFPFGGMENPQLTFVTPTIISGDRSLTSLVAHELAHSWSGNLVTNATWNDFWLNEGFTVYFERRIMEAIYGKDYADMLKVLGYEDLKQTLQELGPENPDTQLKLNLVKRDPDEGLTEIAYEKGNYFLLALEEAFGRPLFDAFVLKYFQDFAFQAMDTEKFLNYLKNQLLNQPQVNPSLIVMLEEWIYGPGLPKSRPALTSVLFNKVDAAAKYWQINSSPSSIPTQSWSTHEWLYFLHRIEPDLTRNKMQDLDNYFSLSQSGNAEIKVIWLRKAVELAYEPAYPHLEEFLHNVGRRKFLMPLYKALISKDQSWAKRIYENARPNYHQVATSSLDKLLL
jgi:leukotriene-A4 hydrolase